MWIGYQASSPERVVLQLLVTTQMYKHGDYKPSSPFHDAQHLASESATLMLPAVIILEFFARKAIIQNL